MGIICKIFKKNDRYGCSESETGRESLKKILKIFSEDTGGIFKKVWKNFIEFCENFIKMWR